MPFNPAIPRPTDLLSDSQDALLKNNGFLDTSFGTDHYKFSDATVNNGKHQVIQMPTQGTQPVTTVDPMFYSFTQPTGSIGTLQYLQGVSPSAAQVQSPLTPLQSSSSGISLAAGATVNVFDFTSSIYCFGTINAMGTRSDNNVFGQFGNFYWNGSKGSVNFYGPTSQTLVFQFSGNVLQIKNDSGAPNNYSFTQVAWTLNFNRIFTPL